MISEVDLTSSMPGSSLRKRLADGAAPCGVA
jgi:hypothetical protein